MFLALTGFPLVLLSIIAFIIIIGLIICIHEFGHYYFAKKAGILCHEFSFGMGPAIFKKQIGETTFCIRLIPIGGYVSMAGEESTADYTKIGTEIGLNFDGDSVSEIILDDNRSAEIRGKIKNVDLEGKDGGPLYITLDLGMQDHYFPVKRDAMFVFEDNKTLQIEPYDRSFDSKTIWQRFITLFAGPMNNFILAIFIYLLVSFISGVPNTKSNVIGSISGKNYPSYNVLEKGDKIISINGKGVSSWTEFDKAADEVYNQEYNEADDTNTTTIHIVVDRKGEEHEFDIETLTIIQSVGISNVGAKKLTPITEEDGYQYKDSEGNMQNITSGILLGTTSFKNENMNVASGAIITKMKVSYDNTDSKRLGFSEKTYELKSWSQIKHIFDEITSEATVSFIDYYSLNDNKTPKNADDDYYEFVSESKQSKTHTDEVLNSQNVDKIVNLIGISSTKKFDFIGSIVNAFKSFGSDFTLVFRTLKILIAPSGVRQIGVNNLSGFVGIFSIIQKYIGNGILPLMAFAAMLSVNIGIMNLLPIPALDGGRIVFLLIEAVTKKKVPKKVESIINTVFFILLMILFVYITVHDIIRLF